MGNHFAGKPPPDLPKLPGEPCDATQAYSLDSGVCIPAASPGSGRALTPSRIYEKQVIYAIAHAVAARFETERKVAEEQKAKAKVDEMPSGPKKQWKRKYPEAVGAATPGSKILRLSAHARNGTTAGVKNHRQSCHQHLHPLSTVTKITCGTFASLLLRERGH